jgi:signal transduction histidine kinase
MESEAKRCFAAFAAHELRGEIAVQLALAEATLADPEADIASLRTMGEQIVDGCERQARLLAALLTLARCEHEPLRSDAVDLAATAARALHDVNCRHLRITARLEPAETTGNAHLIARLVANLIENAIHHNTPAGRLDLATRTTADRATLTISNTGPVIPTGDLTRLFQPFQRLSCGAGGATERFGLGLAIVTAIANAHRANVNAQARTGGGLRIDIDFPAVARTLPLDRQAGSAAEFTSPCIGRAGRSPRSSRAPSRDRPARATPTRSGVPEPAPVK